MKQKKKWVVPKLTILTRDSGTAVLKGCKGSSPPTAGPGSGICSVFVNCCEGPGCVVYPTVPSCSSLCGSGVCQGEGGADMQRAICYCAQYFQGTGMDCTVGGPCVCSSLNVS